MTADRAARSPEKPKKSQWESFFENYKPWVLGTCLSLVVIVGLFFLGKWYMGTRKAEATIRHMVAVAQIKDADDRGQVETAVERLESLAEKGYAGVALLDLGSLNYRLGNFRDAEEAYREFLSQAEPDDPLRPIALEGLAYTLEARGKIEDALKVFEKASRATKKPSRVSLFSLARLSEDLGRTRDAKAYYQEFLQLYPGGDALAGLAEARLKELGR